MTGVQNQLDICSQAYCSPYNPRGETLRPFFELALNFKRHVPLYVRSKLRLAYQFNVQQRMPSARALHFFPSISGAEQTINEFEDTGKITGHIYTYGSWLNTVVLYSWLAPVHAMIRKESRNISKLSTRQRRIRMWLDV